MDSLCHRCGNELASGAPKVSAYERQAALPFCPHCGAPQLYLRDAALFDPASRADPLSRAEAGQHSSFGVSAQEDSTAPPPANAGRTGQVDWQMAIRCAGAVGLVAALLSVAASGVPQLAVVNTFWIVTASLTTLTLYQRRRPGARIDSGVGARIGGLVGVSLVVGVSVAIAAAGLIARFGLHSMQGFDAKWTQVMNDSAAKAAAMSQTPIEQMKAVISPEFMAGVVLVWFGFGMAFLLVLSILGGAFGGMLWARRGIPR